jgi:hypothetical protein
MLLETFISTHYLFKYFRSNEMYRLVCFMLLTNTADNMRYASW